MTLSIFLDSVRKYRNAAEYRNVNRATCEGVESVGDGDNIRKVCADLSAKGYSGDVEVWRDKVLVFSAIPIQRWAEGKALSEEQPNHLRKNRDA